jgi:putative addiction module CopG family antidote
MKISLSQALEDYVNKKVGSGLYRSADEIIEEALLLLQKQEQALERRTQRDGLLTQRLAAPRKKVIAPAETRKGILESLKGDYIGTRRS